MAALDVLILLGFVAYAIATGLRSRRIASRNLEEYFLAGRSLRGWVAGISMAATQFAADTPLLVTGLIATAGIFSLWQLWSYALAFLLLGFVLGPSWRRARVLTDAELAELRYSGRPAAVLRGIKALYFGTLFNCTVLAMVLFAAVEVAEPFLRWNEWLPAPLIEAFEAFVRAVGVPLARGEAGAADVWLRSANNLISIALLVAVTAFYSATGGLRSVVRTDLVQFAIMMGATLGFAVWLVNEAGGMTALLDGLTRRYASGGPGGITADQLLAITPSRAKNASFVVLALFALQWLVQMNADGTGYLAQRTMACRSDRDAKQAALVFTLAQVLVRSLLWLPLGLALLLLFPPDPALSSPDLLEVLRADREASFVRGIEALPQGLLGLMLTAMLAALASTIDTHLNWGASYWTHDLYARFLCRGLLGREPSGRSLVWVARLANLLILAIAMGIMTRLSSLQTAWQMSLLLGAGMGVMLVLRWLWWRVTAWGEIAAIAASALLAPVLLWSVPGEQQALRLLLMALGSTAAGIGASLAGGPEPRSRLEHFFRRVRPPGFWAPVADDPGEPMRRLASGLAATGLAAVTIFALLTGLGSWLVSSPPPVWLPWRGVFVGSLLVLGLALIPLWWKLGFGRDVEEWEAEEAKVP